MNAPRNCPEFFAAEAPSKSKGLDIGHRFDGRLSYSASEFTLDDRQFIPMAHRSDLGGAKFIKKCGVKIFQKQNKSVLIVMKMPMPVSFHKAYSVRGLSSLAAENFNSGILA